MQIIFMRSGLRAGFGVLTADFDFDGLGII
jgi:hypothetical protein